VSPSRNIQLPAAIVALFSAGTTLAHDGHGLTGSHWHATDTVGLLVVAGLGALAFWLSHRGK
jgi:hypothetical protein